MSSAQGPSGGRAGRFRSIGARLALWYTGTLILLSLAMSIFLYYRLRRDLLKEFDRFLGAYSADLADNVLRHREDLETAFAVLHEEIAMIRSAQLEYRIFDETGRVIFSTPGLEDAPPPGDPASLVPQTPQTLDLPGSGYPLRETSALLDLGDGRVWRTQTAVSLKNQVKTLANYRRNIAYFLLPLAAIGILGGLFLARRALRPVAEMAAAAREISSTSLHRRLELCGTGDELDELADALNGMLARLEEAFQRIERFSSDLAHELRSPITQLKGETEAALVSDADAEALRELLARHAEVYDSIKYMISDLLSLLRAGAGAMARAREPLDLGAVLADLADTFRVVAEEEGIRLVYVPPRVPIIVLGDRSSLGRMVSNALDNAIRHTDAGGTVELRAGGSRGTAEILVRDTGEGIPPEDLPHVFERFYRGDRSRSRSTGGFGLGLSIARQIAREHGGAIRIESRVGEGTALRIRLPRDEGAV